MISNQIVRSDLLHIAESILAMSLIVKKFSKFEVNHFMKMKHDSIFILLAVLFVLVSISVSRYYIYIYIKVT